MKPPARVVTLTLHPAIDRVVRVGKLQPGGTFDGRLALAVPAGKGVNTARSLRALCPAPQRIVAAAWLGAAEATWFKKELLDKSDVDAAICARPVATRFAHSFLEASGRETHIKENMLAPDAAQQNELLDFWKKTVRAGDIVALCGSSPSGVKPAVLKRIFEIARECGARSIIADTYGSAMRAAVDASIDVLKGNAAEIGGWLGCAGAFDRHSIDDRARLLDTFSRKRAPKAIFITLGADGAMLATNGTLLYQAPPVLSADFKITSATGCGDAATAGILWSILENDPASEALLRRAVACGTGKLASSDPGGLSQKWVAKFMRALSKIEVTRP